MTEDLTPEATDATTDDAPEATDAPEAPAVPDAPPAPEATDAPEAPAAPESSPAPEAPEAPRPSAPAPTPAMMMKMARPTAPAPVAHPHSESAKHGRVAEDGTVYVLSGEEEREVGSYPGASPEDALQYFARKYDELAASADLLRARIDHPEVASKEIADGLASLKQHIEGAKVVGDLAALDATVSEIEAALSTKRETEAATRAAAKAEAAQAREVLVAEAEKIAAQPPGSTQWKTSTERMRTLLDDWKGHQRSGPKLDKPVEAALWQRFSHARNTFDKARRAWFAELDVVRGDAKAAKEKLVREAEALAGSRDWTPTARAFKGLMDQWRQAGRASRPDDDTLWARFKAAQDAFFTAKDEVVAAEDEEFRTNLTVKEGLLAEAERILPVSDLEAAKASLRSIQDRWDKAGKVPRADIERIEKAMRRVETAVRDAEDRKWKSSNPEVAARASSMATQLRSSIESLRADLTKAEASGNTKKVADLTAKIAAQQAWLGQAEAGLDEFGG